MTLFLLQGLVVKIIVGIFVKSTPQVVLEGDSQVLMIALVNDSTFLSFDGLLIDDVSFSVKFSTQLHYSHVKREGNKVTHNLAQHALCISDFVVGIKDVPPTFLSVVLVDNAVFFFFLIKWIMFPYIYK